MMTFDPASYGPVFEPLLATDRCRALDSGQPHRAALETLEQLTPESAFAHTPIVDFDMAHCCLAGLWLMHDFLDQSHSISQGIETPSGSFWHGIMHRREGDFSNAKYWFRRVGMHAAFEPLAGRAAELVARHGDSSASFIEAGRWEPYAFVDACQQAVRTGSDVELCRAVHQAEWELLFDYCHRAAVGK